MVLRDRDNFAAKAFPKSVLLISAIYWPIVWFLALWYIKALTLSFAHSYADVVLPQYYPWAVIGLSILLPLLVLLIKKKILQESAWAFFYIHLFVILAIALCLGLYYVLTFPLLPFIPQSLIGQLSVLSLKPSVLRISTFILTFIPGIFGNCLILHSEFGTLKPANKNNVIKAWTGAFLVALPVSYFYAEPAGFVILALAGNFFTVKEIMRHLVNKQEETVGTEQ